jgi:transmembrane protein
LDSWQPGCRSTHESIFPLPVLTAAYWVTGLQQLFGWTDAVAEMRSFALRPAPLITAAVIVVKIGGSVLVIADSFVWLGAGALGVFTLQAMLIAYPFWRKRGAERNTLLIGFCEHVGLIAGLVLTAMVAALRLGL